MSAPANSTYPTPSSPSLVVRESDIEAAFIEKLRSLKYTVREDIRDRAALERNFRQKFEALNRVHLTDGEFRRLLDELITPDVFTASRVLREKNDFTRDECHRSQFGDNHKAIKEFFPRAQLFGFTGTPIFEENASRVQVEEDKASYCTTADTFQRELHKYTITHAIEDKNVLRFHVDYYRPEGEQALKPGETLKKEKIVAAILDKHDTATHARRFNALLATASIDDAIEYHALFQTLQTPRQAADPAFVPLKVACVFSPPADGDPDVRQLQEDLPQEKADNEQNPDRKKAALGAIIAAYNARYATNHSIGEFDLYYQDIQKRIKDQKFPNADLPGKGAEKIDVTIVVDMLLTGFDSHYLNTLYVDKTLKHHGLIQADAKFMDERDTIADYVRTLQPGQGLDQREIEAGYRRFRDERHAAELAAVAQKHGLAPARLQAFVDAILQRMVFDGEQLTELLEPLGLNWRARRDAELALMEDLVPLLKKRAAGRDISGLSAYE